MKRKKRFLVFLFPLLIVFVIGVLILTGQVNYRFGLAKSNSIVLSHGTHDVSQIAHEPGEYRIYAVSGAGVVTIDGIEYELDASLLQNMKRDGGIWGKMFAESGIYNESPAVILTKDSVIDVQGDEDFAISFVKH
jgi:hypothetical protein